MTGPRPFSRPENSFAADQELRKKDNDARPKDSYESQNNRGAGTEREYPQDDSGETNNENIEGDRGAA